MVITSHEASQTINLLVMAVQSTVLF